MKKPLIAQQQRWMLKHAPGSLTAGFIVYHLAWKRLQRELIRTPPFRWIKELFNTNT